MKKRIPKFLSVLLLLIFVYNFSGFYIHYKIQKLILRSEFSELVITKKWNQVPIKRITKDFLLIEKNELLFDGSMHDILFKYDSADVLIYVCIEDKNENLLLAELNSHLENNVFGNKNSSKGENHLSKTIAMEYLLPMQVLPIYVGISRSLIYSFEARLSFSFSENIFLPPEFLNHFSA